MAELTFDQRADGLVYIPAAATLARDRVGEWLLFVQIIAATLLQKIAIPVGGHAQIYLGLPVMLGAVVLGIAARRLSIDGARLGLFLLMAAGAILTQLAGGRDFSVLSLGLLLAVHAPYVFRLGHEKAQSDAALRFFQKIMLLAAVLGIVQYFSQFLVGWRYAFFLDSEFPKSFIFQGFHSLNPVNGGANIYKSNGVFFLEPAIFSQFLAVSVVIETVYFHSWKRIVLYLAAIAVTFSGTGLVLLGILMPIFFIQKRRYVPLVVLLLAIASIGVWAPMMGLEKMAGRMGEFMNADTSAYARFLSIFRILEEYSLPHFGALLFGNGAGTFRDITGQVNYAAHDPSWGKIVFEYGLIGALAYFPLMARVFYASAQSGYLRAALALQFLFLGEYVLSPTVHGLIIALLAWPAAKAAARETGRPHG